MIASEALRSTAPALISEASVKAALDSLRYHSRAPLANPLASLSLVDEALIGASLPMSIASRAYMLADLLTSIIRNKLAEHRRVMGLALDRESSRQGALGAIGRDATTANPELIGFSWLYYHYVRVDLDVSTRLFCQIACIDQRTLQRYRRQAIWRLVFRLTDQEKIARQSAHKRHLYALLPTMAPLTLYGRDDALSMLDSFGCTAPQQVEIVGKSGIGKTALVNAAIRSLIDSGAVDSLLWLHRPPSLRAIREQMTHFVDAQGIDLPVREYVQARRSVLVLDGVDRLRDDTESLEYLLSDLGQARVYLTAFAPLPMRTVSGYLVLRELQARDAKSLIGLLCESWHIPGYTQPARADVERVWEQAGGNPGAIVQAVHALQSQRALNGLEFPLSTR